MFRFSLIAPVTAGLFLLASAQAAYFGSIVPIRGHISDIAADPARNLIYAANFTANRIEVYSAASQSLQAPISLPSRQPSAIAISPDGRYLLAGHYSEGNPSPAGALTIIDLNSGAQQSISLGSESVLAAAFGNSPLALVLTTKGVSLVDPVSRNVTSLGLTDFASKPLPVPWATFPADVISGSAGVSGDGNVICMIVDNGSSAYLLRYDVRDGSLGLWNNTFSPPAGPRAVSVDKTGSTFLLGWAMATVRGQNLRGLAQFPYAPGILGKGSHVYDPARSLIYAQVAPGAIQPNSSGDPALLQSFDSDNLTVRETFQLRENLAGRSVFLGDSMYSVSDSGLTVFPMGALSKTHRVAAAQEDLLFQSKGCDQRVLSQYIDISDPGGNSTDFGLSASSPGVTFSTTSGVTPARVQVFVDPAAFQDQKGTAVVSVQITSSSAVNVPAPVRLLINTRNPDQKGDIFNVPGTIVDVLADPARGRFYLLRQDQNQVLVFDSNTMSRIATLRTGNTPMQMAIYQSLLLVTNDNSQLVNLFDLATLQPYDPIFLPPGLYARSIAATGSGILATTRSVAGKPVIVSIDVLSRVATVASTSIYENEIDENAALASSPSGASIFMAMPDGTVALYDNLARSFVASRRDVASLSGAYAALSDDLFFAGATLFGPSLVPAGQFIVRGGLSSGAMAADGKGLVSAAPMGARNGAIQRFSLDTFASISPTATAEAPYLSSGEKPDPLGQTGQTILPFTRTLALLPDAGSVIQVSTSGFTVLPWAFDTPAELPALRAVTNAADQGSGVAPGGLISLWGDRMSEGSAAASSLPLAGALNNVCLYANSVPVPLLFVSPNQVNAQLPFTATGTTDFVLVNEKGVSAPLRSTVLPAAPAVFRMSGGQALVLRADNGQIISDANPIRLDGKIIVYLTGLGAVKGGAEAGVAAPSDPLATTSQTPRVYIGPVQLFTLWSGLAPGMVGVYQINARVPFRDISTGSQVQFTVIQGDAQTILHLPVRN